VDEHRAILVITSCTGLKSIGPGDDPVPAERLYRGEQHRRLMRGVESFRAASPGWDLDLRIVSAGHGVVGGREPLGFYDESFAGVPAMEIERRAAARGIPATIAARLAKPYALGLLLLGDDYMRAASLRPETELGGPTLAFGGGALANRFAGSSSLEVVPAGKREARRFSCGLVGLKGELAGRLLGLLATRPDLVGQVTAPDFDVLGLLDSAPRPMRLAA
jgi:hypothetical protein